MADTHKRAAIYARVSTLNGQTPDNQLLQLREVAERAGWEIVGEYVDEGVSGAKGRDKRPSFDRLVSLIRYRPSEETPVEAYRR